MITGDLPNTWPSFVKILFSTVLLNANTFTQFLGMLMNTMDGFYH